MRGDRVHIAQVILNLLTNGMDAVQNRPANDRRVMLEARAVKGENLEVTVRDSGPGIPDDRFEDVFTPFFTTKEAGLGIGLALSRMIIHAHGGRLRLFDGVPEDAYFYFVHSYYPVVATAVSAARSVGGLTGDARGCGTADLPVRPKLQIAWCDYGVRFAAAIELGRIHATQFHPEKSQRWGLRMLENFAGIVKEAA